MAKAEPGSVAGPIPEVNAANRVAVVDSLAAAVAAAAVVVAVAEKLRSVRRC